MVLCHPFRFNHDCQYNTQKTKCKYDLLRNFFVKQKEPLQKALYCLKCIDALFDDGNFFLGDRLVKVAEGVFGDILAGKNPVPQKP